MENSQLSTVKNKDSNYIRIYDNVIEPEQCKSLESKLDLARKAQQYEMPIRMLGKPILKKVLNLVDKFGV